MKKMSINKTLIFSFENPDFLPTAHMWWWVKGGNNVPPTKTRGAVLTLYYIWNHAYNEEDNNFTFYHLCVKKGI